ncbi:hypothetical protein [Leptospira santarosai]|nr:hypothetical protein [Leptospira santarosai]
MSKPKNRAEELVGNEVLLKQLKALVERAMITQRTPLMEMIYIHGKE